MTAPILCDGFGGHKSVKTCHQRVVERGRNRERGERPGECVVPIDSGELSRLKNGFGHFLDEEWYPVCLLKDLLEHLCWEGFAIGHAYDDLFHLGGG